MSNHNKNKRILKTILVVGVLFIYVIFLQKSQIYSPITYLTKVSMPTTGMTRAWISFIKLDIKTAFQYHGLFLLGPILIGLILAYFYNKKQKYLNYSIVIAAILFVYNLFRIL